MKLYFSPGACSLSPHIVLHEAGLPCETEQVNLGTKQTNLGNDFKAVNPKGYVPALVLDNGQLLTEGPAIVQYLADQKPGSGLAPAAGSVERYQLQEWLNYISTELHKSIGGLFNKKMPAEWRATVKENIANRLDFVTKSLGDKPYLTGDTFTVADAYLFTVLRWTGFVEVDLSKWPTLVDYIARVGERPAVKAAIAAESAGSKAKN